MTCTIICIFVRKDCFSCYRNVTVIIIIIIILFSFFLVMNVGLKNEEDCDISSYIAPNITMEKYEEKVNEVMKQVRHRNEESIILD